MKRLFDFDETDTVIAVSEEAARSFYQQETGFSDEEMATMEVVEIPVEEWPNRTIITDETEEGETEPIKFSLAEWVNQFDENKPQIIASTEC